MTAHVVAATATLIAAVVLIPQIVRLVRRHDASGVSATWAAMGLVGNAAWVVYLVVADHALAAVAPGLAVLSYAVIVRLVAPGAGAGWMPLAVAYGVALGAVAGLAGLEHLAQVLVIVPAVQVAPQVLAVYRAASTAGVSPVSWGLSVTGASTWMVYGTMVGSPALVGYGLVRGAVSGLVLLGWWMSIRHPSTVTITTPASTVALASTSLRV